MSHLTLLVVIFAPKTRIASSGLERVAAVAVNFAGSTRTLPLPSHTVAIAAQVGTRSATVATAMINAWPHSRISTEPL